MSNINLEYSFEKNKEITPKILHQTWKSKDLTPKFKEWQELWLKTCYEYEYKFYTDEDISEVIENYFPQYLTKFNSFSRQIEKIDFWRYAILYIYGGVYADMDVFPLKSIDIWLEKNKIILGREPIEHSESYNGSDFLICNAFMISPKKDKFWLDLMEFIIENYSHDLNAVSTTGPGIITKFYKTYPEKFDNVIITEPTVFYPITRNDIFSKQEEYKGKFYKNVSKNCEMKNAFVVHMWGGTWTSLSNWSLILIAYAFIIVIILVLIFSISIGMGYTK